MTWEPISGRLPQFAASGSAQAAGYVLKFYVVGTTTPLTVSSSSTGSPTTTDFLLDSQGYTTLSAVRVIPHVQTAYKQIVYLNQADADANTTGSAVYIIDNITLGSDIASLGPTIAQYASNGDYFLDSGAADAYILTVISPKEASEDYVDGEVIAFLPDNTNTGASVVNRDGIGSKDLKDQDGNALAAGDITASEEISFRYNLANTEFRQIPTVSLAVKKDLKSGRINKIINGDFLTNQDGLSFTPTAVQYTSDMWIYNFVLDGGTLGSAGQTVTPHTLGQTDVPKNPKNFLNMAGSISGGGTSHQLGQLHKIEDVRSLSGQVVTLSFWIKASATGTVAHYMFQDFGTGGSPSGDVSGYTPVDISLTTSWQQITKTFTMPSVSGKTRGSNNDDFTAFIIYKQMGTAVQSATGAPTAVNFSGTIDISDVQINDASFDTDFDRVSEGQSQSMCERYYQILTLGGNNPLIGRITSSTMISNRIAFQTTMRAIPTATVTGNTITSVVLDTGSAPNTGAAIATSATINSIAVAVSSAGGTNGSFYGMTWSGAAEVFKLDARL